MEKSEKRLNPQWAQILNKLAKRLILRGSTHNKRVLLHITEQLVQGLTISEIEKQVLIQLMRKNLPTRYESFDFPGYVRLNDNQRYKPAVRALMSETQMLLKDNLNSLVDGRSSRTDDSLIHLIISRLTKSFKGLLKNGK